MTYILMRIDILQIELFDQLSRPMSQCWADVGPSSTTLAQHQPGIGIYQKQCYYFQWYFILFEIILKLYNIIHVLKDLGYFE